MIFQFLEDKEVLQMQLLSRRFYKTIVPKAMMGCLGNLQVQETKEQDSLYHFQCGYITKLNLDTLSKTQIGEGAHVDWKLLRS